MRCEFVKCRAALIARVDRIGRVHYVCPLCDRRKRGLCRLCPNPVVGKIGMAFYCEPCRKIRTLSYSSKWQKNNPEKVADNVRRRRYAKKGLPVPDRKMPRAERGRIGGSKGKETRKQLLGPDRLRAIAERASKARWAKFYAERARTTLETPRE